MSADRGLRSDARRNRTKLLVAARACFAAADDAVSLESIARDAGVGIGTLYRHFPTREALVEAVYAAELDDVTSSAATLLDQLTPEDALLAWMQRYAAFVTTKRAMIASLRTGWTPNQLTTTNTRARINECIGTILDAGSRAGALRGDVDPDDVTAMLLGACLASASSPEQTSRLFSLIIDGLRTASAN